MRVFARVCTGSVSVCRPLPLSSQRFCDTEDVVRLMQPHVKADGNVDTLHVEFESMNVPICHLSELRIVAQLAAAYNNAIIAQSMQWEKDLAGAPYAPEPEEAAPGPDGTPRSGQHAAIWDEELLGDKFIYNAEYEQNEQFVPWLLRENEERFGWYA